MPNTDGEQSERIRLIFSVDGDMSEDGGEQIEQEPPEPSKRKHLRRIHLPSRKSQHPTRSATPNNPPSVPRRKKLPVLRKSVHDRYKRISTALEVEKRAAMAETIFQMAEWLEPERDPPPCRNETKAAKRSREREFWRDSDVVVKSVIHEEEDGPVRLRSLTIVGAEPQRAGPFAPPHPA